MAISVDDLLRREVQKKADQGMNGGVESFGVPVRFGTESSGPDGTNGVIFSQGDGLVRQCKNNPNIVISVIYFLLPFC